MSLLSNACRPLLGAILLLALNLGVANAESQPIEIQYTVAIKSTEEQLFKVTTQIRNLDQAYLDLSLPTWTPGWYTIENYAKNILRFRASGNDGAGLPLTMVRKQTWRIRTEGLRELKVEFDYLANVLALNQARIAPDFAFFTGTQLFLLPEGYRESPSTVRFVAPEGWRIVSALEDTPDPAVFRARDYDTLVDAPTNMGKFDLTTFSIDGKPHHFVATPAGSFSRSDTHRFVHILTLIAKTQKAIFGDLPYEKFVYYYFFARAESRAAGGLEHSNSFVAFAPPDGQASPDRMAGLAAHEFFHVWNVKRFRPVDFQPYDYSRENETSLLWVAEGFTVYYTGRTLLRSGLNTRTTFLDNLARAISSVERNEARNYISLADASVSTWVGYDTPVAFGISYYVAGGVVGALLDLSIRNDTGGRRGLDDVMRALYQEHHRRNRGFSRDDVLNLINRTSERDYSEFFRRYIEGTEVPPYREIFANAGIDFRMNEDKTALLTEMSSASPEQRRLRDSWLGRN